MRDPTRGGLGSILAEIAEQAQALIELTEQDIPVREEVVGLCEILGLDPLFLACEGRVVIFCAPEATAPILQVLRNHAYGRDAAAIGVVQKKGDGRGRVIQQSAFGGTREIDLPLGELVPRIC